MVSISRLLKETHAILNLAVHDKNTSHEDKLRMKYYLIFLLCGIPLIFAFGVYNVLKGNQTLFILLLLNLILLLLAWFHIFSYPHPKRYYRMSIYPMYPMIHEIGRAS